MILSYIRQICIRQKLKHGLPSIFLYFIFSGFLWNTSILKFHFIFLVSIIYAKHTRDKSKKIIIIYYIINYDAIILRPWNLNVDVNSSIVRSIWFFFFRVQLLWYKYNILHNLYNVCEWPISVNLLRRT